MNKNTKNLSVNDILLMGMGESVRPKKVANKTVKVKPCNVTMLAESYAYIMSDVEKRKYQVLAMSHYATVKMARGESASAVLDKVKSAGVKVKDIVVKLFQALGRYLREAYNFIVGKIKIAKTAVKATINKLKDLKGKKVVISNYDKNIIKNIGKMYDLVMKGKKDVKVPSTPEETLKVLNEIAKLQEAMSNAVMDAETAPTTQSAEEAVAYYQKLDEELNTKYAVVAATMRDNAAVIQKIQAEVKKANADANPGIFTRIREKLPDVTKISNTARTTVVNQINKVTAACKVKEAK